MNLLLTNYQNLTHNHQKLIAILEAYVTIYQGDLHNHLWKEEVSLTLQEARELQEQVKNLWITLQN
ncbi:protein of unknown function [Tenacibaculum sp. 190524A02b]|uniref:hypothetical protein n=1 Tax=Tenacibaculum vairaonense TaxID=3137860 RepID=UPI0032B273BC